MEILIHTDTKQSSQDFGFMIRSLFLRYNWKCTVFSCQISFERHSDSIVSRETVFTEQVAKILTEMKWILTFQEKMVLIEYH